MARATVVLAVVLAAVLLSPGGSPGASTRPRIGFVIYAGATPSPRTLEGQHLLGFMRAEKQLPIDGRIVYISPTTDPTATLRSLARQHYDLVIGAVTDRQPFATVAPQFPDVRFLMDDIPFSGGPKLPKNVEGSIYRAEEAAFLAGYLAALMDDRRPGPHVVSAVGGFPFSGVTRWLVGYRAGARYADPKIGVRIAYSGDFQDAAKCKRIALAQIAAGSGVVFNVAGPCGLGALSAARARGVWGVGVDVDQSFLGPHILTSAMLRADNGIYEAIDRYVHGKLPTGGNVVFDLADGGVELGRISPRVPAAILRRVEAVRKKILAGTVTVPHVT
jgi:basic membrane protein A and related proteins